MMIRRRASSTSVVTPTSENVFGRQDWVCCGVGAGAAGEETSPTTTCCCEEDLEGLVTNVETLKALLRREEETYSPCEDYISLSATTAAASDSDTLCDEEDSHNYVKEEWRRKLCEVSTSKTRESTLSHIIL
jgi:hypothetical protein